MSYRAIRYETDDRVAILTFNRPERLNAFDQQLKNEVGAAIKAFDADPTLRVMVITGEGSRAFSTGYDLKESTNTPRTDIERWRARLHDDYKFTRAPWECSKPVIAMIDGHCLAGGLEFSQMCDVRYSSDAATFGVVETRFSAGVVTMVMPWIIGQRCRELIFTGDTIGADEALRIGLVSRVFPQAALREEVLKIAKRMSQVALSCLVWNKRAITAAYETMGFDSAMRYGLEACTIMDTVHTPEYVQFAAIREKEGLVAALRWRDAQFTRYE
jgi:enoyl-CoA hydratase/carnithine racemase